MDEDADRVYHASAWLADFIRDLGERDLLVGEVRFAAWDFVEHFRITTGSDPERWHSEFYDYYAEIRGEQPEQF